MDSKCESVVFFVNSRVLGNHFLMLCRFYLYSCEHGWAVMSQSIGPFTYVNTARNALALRASHARQALCTLGKPGLIGVCLWSFLGGGANAAPMGHMCLFCSNVCKWL